MRTVTRYIEQGVEQLLAHSVFSDWLADQAPNSGDLILVNDSFVFRDLGTRKSGEHVTLRVLKNASIDPRPLISAGLRFNSDFKLISSGSHNHPELMPLDEAVQHGRGRLGSLLFILIGRVDDSVRTELPFPHSGFKSIILDPTLSDVAVVSDGAISVKDTADEDAVWATILEHYAATGDSAPDDLRQALGIALDKLQDVAVASLHLPTRSGSVDGGMTDAIIEVLREQRASYAAAVAKSGGHANRSPAAFTELLRIAYNFANDATTYLTLILNVCDLKPIVFWGTIAEHFKLSEAFRNLPWTRSRNKPFLNNYTSTIADARNSSFHNLFPFRKSLDVVLPGSALRKVNLRLFSEHGKKKENRLYFQDQELVDVLFKFTRARERRVTPRFWTQNLEVMDATINLFSSTSSFLKVLRRTAPRHESTSHGP